MSCILNVLGLTPRSINCCLLLLILMFLESNQAKFVFPTEQAPCEEAGRACVAIANCPEALSTIDSSSSNSARICGWTNAHPQVCCSIKERMQLEEGCGLIAASNVVVSASIIGKSRRSASARLAQTQVAGGEISVHNSRPWMAAILYRASEADEFTAICGGALITLKYVLTAAHCFVGRSTDPKHYKIVLGTTNLFPGMNGGSIDTIIVHENFKPPSLYNDIALVRVKDRTIYSNSRRPICLPDPNEINSLLLHPLTAIAAGWGRTGFFEGTSNELREVDLPIVNNSKCNDIYSELDALRGQYSNGLTNQIICAGYETEKKDTCPGDSGGPLFVKSTLTHLWTVIGIVSSGYRCAAGIPGIYTNVASYSDWIEKHISS